MNILIITRLLTSGGAERVAANLATELNKAHSVKLLVFDGRNSTYSCEAEIVDLKLPMQERTIKKLIWYIKAIRSVSRIKKEFGITHTISFLNEADLINALTPTGKRIISVRSHRSKANKNSITFIKDKIVFNHVDRIVALSKGVKDDLVNYYRISSNLIDVIYNACDVEKIKNEMRQKPDDDYLELICGHDVVNAGRLVDEKGQWHLIRSFIKVVKYVPDARLFILGKGPHEQYFRKLILDNSLSNSVYLLGYKENPYPYLCKGSLFVFSSIREGFGNVLLEAMACGLPIISSDCLYGPRELLEPDSAYEDICIEDACKARYGILVPAGDNTKYTNEPLTQEEEIMADEIIRLITDKKELRKYSDLSKQRITDFSVEEIIKQWERALELC